MTCFEGTAGVAKCMERLDHSLTICIEGGSRERVSSCRGAKHIISELPKVDPSKP
jgi:hypothetical protein